MDGKPLKPAEQLLYFMLNKPKGYVTTVSDPEGRPTVMEFVSYRKERLYPVGRLDYASEGLLLMTNDGELAQKLTKAGSHMPKTYHVKISGRPDEKAIERLRCGIMITLEDGETVKTSPAKIRLLEDAPNPWYEVDSDRRPQSPNPPYVSEYRLSGGKNQTCATRSAKTRRATRKSSPADSARSGTIKSPDAHASVTAVIAPY